VTGRQPPHAGPSPMSRSPPLRSATTHAESRPQQPALATPSSSTSHDAYGRFAPQAPSVESQSSPMYSYNQAGPPRQLQPLETMERFPPAYQSSSSFPGPTFLPPQTLPRMSQALPQHTLLPTSASVPSSGHLMTNQQPPAAESPAQTSPKSQRKAKGHVASACVPCKRAHLR
jgi:hypothetical protein